MRDKYFDAVGVGTFSPIERWNAHRGCLPGSLALTSTPTPSKQVELITSLPSPAWS